MTTFRTPQKDDQVRAVGCSYDVVATNAEGWADLWQTDCSQDEHSEALTFIINVLEATESELAEKLGMIYLKL